MMLAATLRSICCQTSPDFKVVCCYTDKPDITFEHPSLVFIKIKDKYNHSFGENDKATKILQAIEHAESLKPNYVMIADADDFISNRIAEYVLSQPLSDGFIITEGFVYEASTKHFYRLKTGFNMHCESCLIVPIETAKKLVRNHDHQAKDLKLSAIPFAAAIYNIMNGENMSANSPIQNRPIFASEIEICEITDNIKSDLCFNPCI